MSTNFLPQAFWFRVAIPCKRVDDIPKEKGNLLALPDSCILPSFAGLEGREAWSEVRAAWNPRGLALAFEVRGKLGPIVNDPTRPFASDGVQFWIDTRDTRDIHRASRFCSRFVVSISGGSKGLKAEVSQKPIARATVDAPLAKSGAILSQAYLIKGGWRVEVFLPAESLNGFDPDTNRRLGFTHEVSDPDRGSEFLTIGRDFPIGEDPSLWATFELRD